MKMVRKWKGVFRYNEYPKEHGHEALNISIDAYNVDIEKCTFLVKWVKGIEMNNSLFFDLISNIYFTRPKVQKRLQFELKVFK